MRAPEVYQRIVGVMESLGYTRWRRTLSFREVPALQADGLFQVVPASVEPQAAGSGGRCIDTSRTWRVTALFRVLGSVPEIVQDRVLPEEERITDALLGLGEVESVSASYSDSDEGGGFISLSLEILTQYDRPL